MTCAHAGSWTSDLFQQMPVLTACVNETLRLYPPAAQFARVAAADEVLGGYQIPKGMIVVSSIYNMHR